MRPPGRVLHNTGTMTPGHDLPYDVNCSILFTELPLLERPAAARAAGFGGVEFWWPFPEAVPPDAEVEAFVRSVADAGVQLVGLNFAAGDLAGGDRGLVSWPARSAELRDNVAVIDRVAAATGVANLGLLCDLYHLASNGDDLERVIADHGHRVAHVQIADAPGRHEPGSGTLDLDRYLSLLAAAGYAGWVGLEYQPSGASADSFGWLGTLGAGAAR